MNVWKGSSGAPAYTPNWRPVTERARELWAALVYLPFNEEACTPKDALVHGLIETADYEAEEPGEA